MCKFIKIEKVFREKYRKVACEMEINKDILSKIKSLDDNQLRKAIEDVADALGATPQQKRRALNNTRAIKRKINSADENELKRQMSKMTQEQRDEVMKKLKF